MPRNQAVTGIVTINGAHPASGTLLYLSEIAYWVMDEVGVTMIHLGDIVKINE